MGLGGAEGRQAAAAAQQHHGHPVPQRGPGTDHGVAVNGEKAGYCDIRHGRYVLLRYINSRVVFGTQPSAPLGIEAQ